ncbi:hypothetical protein WMY93_005796 [Mugilogobius chulae]|uniref:Uncharacterized protein n=1 Tax=Mugilogobius chulae TaxID=88201 RepID=A0AAW0PMA1_9GOBI
MLTFFLSCKPGSLSRTLAYPLLQRGSDVGLLPQPFVRERDTCVGVRVRVTKEAQKTRHVPRPHAAHGPHTHTRVTHSLVTGESSRTDLRHRRVVVSVELARSGVPPPPAPHVGTAGPSRPEPVTDVPRGVGRREETLQGRVDFRNTAVLPGERGGYLSQPCARGAVRGEGRGGV